MNLSQNSAEVSCPPAPVNNYLLRLAEPEGEFRELRRRIMGYLFGCFGRGARFIYWSHEKFARATRGYRARSAKHIARVWGVFRRLSPNFDCVLVRVGRSFRWRVSLRARAPLPAVTNAEVRNRLAGYIAAAVRAKGARRVVVDAAFLAAFAKCTGLPIARAEHAARVLKLPAAGRLSPPQNPLYLSSASQRRDFKQTTREAAPFFISGRWVSRHRLLALACALAAGALREAHAGHARVRWRFAHARNFAFRALCAGHQAGQIVKKYRAGVGRSHADAVDCGEGREDPPREPSATVAYAWAGLEDGQSAAARWAAFFTTPRENAAVRRVAALAAAEKRKALRSKSQPAQNAGVSAGGDFILQQVSLRSENCCRMKTFTGFTNLPQPAPSPERLLSYLHLRGISWATFSAMPWAHKQCLVERSAGYETCAR